MSKCKRKKCYETETKKVKKLLNFEVGNTGDISDNLLTECELEFKENPTNIITRNAINSVGSMLSTVNSVRSNEISHIFLNSVKKPRVRATNQGASGRCWIFAALNMFRHIVINVLNLENFEFSEVYLFFWDKFERSNTYIKWFIEHPESNPGDRDFDYMVTDYMTSDGGWWNMLASLVQKYGLVPISAMKETYQSDDSADMNQIIKEQLDCCINHICNNRSKLSIEEIDQIRVNTLKQIYNTLVKFLGEPPKKFDWSFTNGEEETAVLGSMTPHAFFDMVAPEVNMKDDFVVLAHLPCKDLETDKNYRLLYTNNVYESEPCTFFNTSLDELAKYAMKSISAGIAVWVVGDVQKSFNWFAQALDDQLDDHDRVFGEMFKFSKGDRITMRNVQGSHAMCLTGFNLDEHGKPISWQCENSWGYSDPETPGRDGFLYMSHSWFKKYVVMIVVNKKTLSRNMRKKINCDAIELKPWDGMAPATRTNGQGVPIKYQKMLQDIRKV